MSKITDKIIELLNEREVISNCCASRLVENSYSYDPEFGASGKCADCNEGCGVEVIPELDSAGFDADGNDHYNPNKYYNHHDLPGFEGTWDQLNQL